MLEITVNNLGDVRILRCSGQITFGYADTLQILVLKQRHIRIAVLDLSEIRAIDAAGLGILVFLRTRATTSGTTLKLMNLTPRVEDLLELTNLRSAFEICSVPEMLDLLCRAFDQAQFAGSEAAAESPGQILDDTEPIFVQDQW
jgi:anti-sigma B factor antagonist